MCIYIYNLLMCRRSQSVVAPTPDVHAESSLPLNSRHAPRVKLVVFNLQHLLRLPILGIDGLAGNHCDFCWRRSFSILWWWRRNILY